MNAQTVNTLRAKLAELKSAKADLKAIVKMNELRNLAKELEIASSEFGKNPTAEYMKDVIKRILVSQIDVIEETTLPELIIAEAAAADRAELARIAEAEAAGKPVTPKKQKSAKAKKPTDDRVKIAVRDSIVGQRIQYPNGTTYEVVENTKAGELVTVVMQQVTADGTAGKKYNVTSERFLNGMVALVDNADLTVSDHDVPAAVTEDVPAEAAE